MIVRVYDFLSAEKPKFSQNLVGIVSDVESFKYTRRAYDIGSFEMTIPTHADEAGCIQPDRMLIVGEKLSQTYIASDPTKRIVRGTFLYVTDIEKKDDKITVTGYDLKYLFALRVTLFPKEEQDKGTYGYYVTSGTTFSCISNIINYNIVNATDSDRQIYGMFGITMPVNQINADPPLTGIQDDRYMTRLEPVSTAIFNLLKNCKTHFYDMRLIIDDNAEDGDSYNPHMESSEDKPVIIIDESRYNIKSYTRKDGTSAYKNAIYAVVGSGDDVTVKCVKRPNDTASGVKRKEVVLDVDTDSVAEIDRYALKAAEEYVISDDFEIEPLFMDDETEPELAQKVSIRIDGVEYETVITEITDEYANGKHTQSYVCGDKKLKVLNVLNKATAGNTQKIVNNKIAMGNKTGVGVFVNYDRTSEIFNDYSGNTAYGNYSHVEGYKNRMDSEGAIRSWATHIEGYENTEASQTSCPSDKKASNNHIEGRMNNCYGRVNHVEGVNCFAEYDTQVCHVEGSNCRVSEGARVAHVEGKDCVAGNECSHAEGKSAQATGYASHAEGESCIASGNYSHAGGLSSEASGKCSYTGGELGTASGDYSHTEGLSNTASGNYSHALGKDNTAIGDYSVVNGAGNKATGSYAIAHGYKCIANSGSMAIGNQSQAVNNSYAFGTGLKAYMQTVAFGMYNKETNARFVIGGGTADNPFDVLWIDRECNLHVAGKVIADGGVGYVLPTATADTLGGVRIGDNITVTDDGTISVDLSSYLKSAEIADWAKQPEKPVYTADEVGAAAEEHTHSTADITDMPDWAKQPVKPTYTASEVGAATPYELDSKDYLKATEITGQVIDLNDIMLNTALDKGKSQRYFCASASAQNISNRPVSANEPFELTVDNIRYVNANAFNSVQRYTSVSRKRSYTRWCDDKTWRAWMCDTDIVIYGTVTAELPKSFEYATYGEGYNQVEIEPYYDSNTSPIRNRIVLTLTSATSYDRDVLTVGDSVEHLKIENGTITMSLTGTKTLSFMIKYTNKRA